MALDKYNSNYTAAQLAALNPVVPDSAIYRARDTGQVRMGDGAANYNDLPILIQYPSDLSVLASALVAGSLGSAGTYPKTTNGAQTLVASAAPDRIALIIVTVTETFAAGDGNVASGTESASGNPANNAVLPALNGFAGSITFKDAPGAFPDVQREVDLATTLATLAAQLELNKAVGGNEALDGYSYTSDATHLIVTADAGGAAGNSYTFGANAGVFTRSGATLAGGLDGVATSFDIGETDTPHKFKQNFNSGTVDDVKVYTGTLSGTKDLLVTGTPAVATGTGAVDVAVLLIPVSA